MNSLRIKNIFKKTLQISSPENYVSRSVSFKDNKILINKKLFEIDGKIHVLAFGKASISMFNGLKREIGIKNITSALIISHMQRMPKNTSKIKFLY